MRILFISDLLLPTENSIRPKDFYVEHPVEIKFNYLDETHRPFFSLTAYIELIDTTQPDLVLIGGDMLADEKESQSVSFDALLSFLEYLNSRKIQCFFIQGNHDIFSYDKLLKRVKSLDYIDDISDKIIEWRDKRFLGLSHTFTYSLKNCRNIKNLFPEKFDFVLGHVLEQRRIWLFNLDTEFIFTGHRGIAITRIENKYLLSTDMSPMFYLLLDYTKQECVMEFHYQSTDNMRTTFDKAYNKDYYKPKPPIITKLTKQNENVIWHKDELKLRSSIFTRRIKALYKVKKKFLSGSFKNQEKIVNELLQKGIPRTWIFEYLNWKFLHCEICGKRFHNKTGLEYHYTTHNKK